MMYGWIAAGIAVLVVVALHRLVVIAAPDEWLLRIRNGRLVDAGIGIWILRRPGDRVARFSSTVQRVAFLAEGLCRERIGVAVEGFILWSVAADDDRPFLAFRRLGIANLAGHDLPGGHDHRHLLTRAQYHAFQRMLAATAQRLVGGWSLDDLLTSQDTLVMELRQRLEALTAPLGLVLEEVELTRVVPVHEDLARDLAAPREQEVRAVAERARISVDEDVARQRAVIERESVEAQLDRDQLTLDAELAARRRRLEVRRDAIEMLARAEEKKSQAVRDFELARLATVKMAESFARLPLERAEWVSIGEESPAAALAGLLATAQRLTKS